MNVIGKNKIQYLALGHTKNIHAKACMQDLEDLETQISDFNF